MDFLAQIQKNLNFFKIQTNSFQVVLVSDGQLSFVFFSYGDIQWGGNAFIGFNLGERRNFSVPGSQTASIVDVETRSNVGVPGLFVYRVDQVNVIEPGGSFNQGKTQHIRRKKSYKNNLIGHQCIHCAYITIEYKPKKYYT